MNKNFTFAERVKLEYSLNNNLYMSASKLAKLFNKSRSTIYYELKHFVSNVRSNDTWNKGFDYHCPSLDKFPFCCNPCSNKRCSHRSRVYDAYKANETASHLLHNSRVDNVKRKRKIKKIDDSISQLIINGLSIKVASDSITDFNIPESTVRRYIEKGLVKAKRIDLPRAVRFRAKKEYKYNTPKLDINLLNNRTYDDYKAYMESHPNASVIQVDSVIGKSNDKVALLTVFFLNSKLQLGFLYNRKYSNVVTILKDLYELGLKYDCKLFDVVLADNGTEFKKLYELENINEEIICRTFFCDPYKSCQKAECEKNHGFFRRYIPKGKSLNTIPQTTIEYIFSNINSYPRQSLDNKTPYDLFLAEFCEGVLLELNIIKIKVSKIKMKPII